jgi:hypothetical protein
MLRLGKRNLAGAALGVRLAALLRFGISAHHHGTAKEP